MPHLTGDAGAGDVGQARRAKGGDVGADLRGRRQQRGQCRKLRLRRAADPQSVIGVRGRPLHALQGACSGIL